jgi:hypothetical protein
METNRINTHRGDEIQEGPQGDDLYYKVRKLVSFVRLTEGASSLYLARGPMDWLAGLFTS